jgi:2-polyprenyl-3-methyl-5-hydroxy-6-metoxy-1,4-benzoquinol methylase
MSGISDMTIKLERISCCVCSNANLVFYRRVTNFPVYMGTTEEPAETDLFFDQNWGTCSECGLLQLMDLIPLDVLYSKNHITEAVGETWKSHHNDFAEFILESNPQKILEIGGAHGDLARRILAFDDSVQYTFIEPSPGNIPNGCKLIVGYIEDNLDSITSNDCIIHSHVIEHIYNPASFIVEVAGKMKIGAKMLVSFPNIEQLLRTGGTNSLNFEHTYFLTPDQLQILCQNTGLVITRQKEFRHHSFFWELTKVNETQPNVVIPTISHKNIQFDRLWEELSEFVVRCNSLLLEKEADTYVFGAHVFTQGMITLGLNTGKIKGILDNALDKQNKRLYGTDLSVFSPECLVGSSNARVILRATHYQEEIKKQLRELNPNLEIIE